MGGGLTIPRRRRLTLPRLAAAVSHSRDTSGPRPLVGSPRWPPLWTPRWGAPAPVDAGSLPRAEPTPKAPPSPADPPLGAPEPGPLRLSSSPPENPAGMFDSGSPLCDSPPRPDRFVRSTRTSRCRALSSAGGLQRLAFSAGIDRPPRPSQDLSVRELTEPCRFESGVQRRIASLSSWVRKGLRTSVVALGCALATNQYDLSLAASAARWLPTSHLTRDLHRGPQASPARLAERYA